MEGVLSYGRVAFAIIAISYCFFCFTSSPAIACRHPQRNLLLDFKATLVDVNNTLSAWNGYNCCMWSGVSCNLRTGHVSGLDFRGCYLKGNISSSLFQLEQLEYLDLSENLFNVVKGHIPSAIGNISSLESLALEYTNIEGEIPLSIVNLSNLVHLDLFHNKLTGIIPPSLGSLSSLSYLDLGYNLLNGAFPSTVSDLVNLRILYLDSINLRGSISFSLFDNLTRLEFLVLSFNHLSVSIYSTWIPPFEKLSFLGLGSCRLDRIPPLLAKQYNLEQLDLSLNSVKNIPSWIWKFPSLDKLNLSCNQLTGSLPSSLTSTAYLYLDLHNNSLQGAIPVPPAGVKVLDLSMNQFNGSIPIDIGEHLQHALFLSLSRNNLSAAIPDSVCTSSLQVLGLSNNMLSGMIPPHLTRNCTFLRVLDLAENHLEGKIPAEWGNLKEINTLKLAGNQFRGIIPSSMLKCQSLQVLDLGNNNLEGTIPHWIGKLSQLHVLILRSNKFQGSIPPHVIDLPNLQILDLSSNNLSGTIPSNLTNLLAIVNASQSNPNHLEQHTSEKTVFTINTVYTNNIAISWKGGHAEFLKVLFVLKCIDLSNNNLSGSIPLKMGSLQGLITLNLSMNHLSGRIPKTLGGMDQLESLDLSLNKLHGKIPLELQLLNYLQFLNLSYNMLDGEVPHGGQFLTFGESSYLSNPKLSGIPSSNTTVCNNSSGYGNCTSIDTGVEAGNSDADMIGWAVGLGLSSGLGFSIIEVHKFDGSNFSLWKLMIQALLVKDGCDRALKGVASKPTNMSMLDWNTMDSMARETIQLYLENSVLFNVAEDKSTHDLWNKLAKLYDTKSLGTMVSDVDMGSLSTWNQRLGHMSERGLKNRLSFSRSVTRSQDVLDLIHLDTWEAPVISIRGSSYFVLFIDDYSHKITKQNGVVECMNRTIMERARCMLSTVGLEHKFLDFGGDRDKGKSTRGYVSSLVGGVVSWVSKLQAVIALSTTEAEYIVET
ncbi:receptor like protein 26-like [Cryptomeria japonica]|uniref:receptor like protein 26-like n=1 Tax=Cryptomeria japonica TaxID=3369 RepID=UPI0027DAA4FA|nr:receptor like protein 26-like [Cryptomeria japonica]